MSLSSASSASRDDEVRKSIRTLTSLLHRFNVQKSPSKHSKDIPPILRHFTTLLTCDKRQDEQAKKVIAITCAVASDRVKTLIVTQNRLLASSENSLSVKMIPKVERTLEEVVKGAPSVPLASHIADVWTAISAFEGLTPDRESQVESLQLFFLTRSYHKFLARFKEGKKLCGNRWLYEIIDDWQPNRPEISCKWIVIPHWLLTFYGIPPMKSRMAGEDVEWEFSDDTKQAWAKMLQVILKDLHGGIECVVSASTEQKSAAMRRVHFSCVALDYFVNWDAGIVKTLLTQTSIVNGITTTFIPERNSTDETDANNDELKEPDESDDEIDELLQEPNETKGQQVYRYLRTLVAWHAAVSELCEDRSVPELLKRLEIVLIEVPRSQSTVLTLRQVSGTFVNRFPVMKLSNEDVLTMLMARCSNKFTFCVHAEATLMGLVNYYGTRSGHDAVVKCENVHQIQDIIEDVMVAGKAVIAGSNKCCWCCDWLGHNLDVEFRLPGTHGVMFPWDPPMGVDVHVLGKLEDELWREMKHAVSSEVHTLLYSRHTSPASSGEGRPRKAMLRSIPRK